MLLELDSVTVGYGAIDAVHELSLRVGAGEIVSLIGANGAGKTTTLAGVMGLTPARSGAIRFDGKPIARLRTERIARQGIALVPEGRRVFPGLSVRENLEVGTSAWGGSGRRVGEEIERVFGLFPHLRERSRQLAWSLSGGEQQMLAVGRALVARPRVLLLDEPSLGLAPRIARQVILEVAGVARDRGLSVLLVEQNAALALSVADRAYVIETGRLLLEGPAADVARDPMVRKAYLGATAERPELTEDQAPTGARTDPAPEGLR